MAQRFRVLLLALLVLPAAAAASLSESYGKLPLHFEENRGQVDKQVRFLARGPGYGLYLTASEAVLALGAKDRRALRMALVGANADSQVSGLDELPGKANYFIGKDSAKWRTNVPTYAKVHYREIYPGIDLVYYGNQRQLEYDFVVAPGADPKRIALRFDGAEKLEIDANGELVLRVAQGDVRVKKPVVYQDIDGKRQEIDGRFVVRDDERVGFHLAAYDTSEPLVIDPVVLAFSTYLGGSGEDQGGSIAVDGAGSAYITGYTSSLDFPTTPGAVQTTRGGTSFVGDVFVTKLDPAGSAIVYSTYLGGSDYEHGNGIAVDSAGNAYVAGQTRSADFPTTAGALRTTFAGPAGDSDGFVAKLDATGAVLAYSTYLAGSGSDRANAIAVDAAGSAYVSGYTRSRDFPATAGAFQPNYAMNAINAGDAFVAKLNSGGSALAYATYLGGWSDDSGNAIAVDALGNAYVAGTHGGSFPTTLGAWRTTNGHVFVTKVDAAGASLLYSTSFGGSGLEEGRGVAIDGDGNAYVTGWTSSIDFPTFAAYQPVLAPRLRQPGPHEPPTTDAFVTKINAAGSAPVYSTYLGGNDYDSGSAIAVDAGGYAVVTGTTWGANFPTTLGAFQPVFGGGPTDAFVTKLHSTGSVLVYSSYLGGVGDDPAKGIALDANGSAYVTGWTSASNFPITVGAFQPTFGGGIDSYVAKLTEVGLLPGAPPSAGTATRFEEDAATYQGYWPTYGSETGTFSGGTIRASNQATATATFTFTGTAVSWIGVKCNVCGIATVQIDGGAPTVVDTFGPGEPGSLTSGPVFTASGLTPGATHTLTIIVTGGGAAVPGVLTGSAHVAVDAFDVTQ
jgi:beta-propeller repeat-containing protein